MRVAIGSLMQESNAFCVARTGMQDFRNKYLETGPDLIKHLAGTRTEMGGAIAELEKTGADIAPLLATHGGSGGIVERKCHQALRDELLDRLRAAAPFDGTFLALHGAMMAEDADDVEGELLAEVRHIAGSAPIAISCDLHANITPAMLANCDILIGYQHYPHDDAPETAARAVRCLVDTIEGRMKPTMAVSKLPILFSPHLEHTFGVGPMVDLDRIARSIENDDGPVDVVSYFPVQPWLDVPGMGFAAVVVSNDDAAAAEATANRIASEAWQRRHDFDVETVPVDDAIRAALAIGGGPVILADTSDCVGGGSTGDGAAVLEALLRLAPNTSSLVHIVDPVAAEQATKVGSGAEVATEVGNRIDTSRGAPVPILATVERVFNGQFTYDGGFLGGITASMGQSAVLAVDETRILVSTYAAYEWGYESYRAAGLDVRSTRLVSVKNPMNYRLTYPFAAGAFVLDTEGPTTPNLRGLTWNKLARPFYPKDDLVDLGR
jgi:microcystin degradation protein MlrC